MAKNLYRGFSTFNKFKKFRVTDFELAKQDLFNHLHIRKGEKLMNPDFGTIIWNVLFEPFSESMRSAIADDLKRIVSYDPRLVVDEIIVTSVDQGIMVELSVIFKQTNELSRMSMLFDQGAVT